MLFQSYWDGLNQYYAIDKESWPRTYHSDSLHYSVCDKYQNRVCWFHMISKRDKKFSYLGPRKCFTKKRNCKIPVGQVRSPVLSKSSCASSDKLSNLARKKSQLRISWSCSRLARRCIQCRIILLSLITASNWNSRHWHIH